MVIQIDLGKTYGSQNEDISKKNKYNSVIVPVITNLDDPSASATTTIETAISETDNITKKNVSIFEKEWKSGTWIWETCKVKNPTYIVEVLYKTYDISISKTDYPELSQIRSVPDYIGSYDGSLRNETSGTSFVINEISNFSQYKSYFSSLNLTGPLFSQVTPTVKTLDFSKNIYTVTSDSATDDSEQEVNIIDEISGIIQEGTEKTQNKTLTDILDFINAKITSVKNSADTVQFFTRCPYKIKIYQSNDCGCLDQTGIAGRFYGQVKSYLFNEYTISKAYIDIYTELNTTTQSEKFFDGDRELSADRSYLFNSSNYIKTAPAKQYAEKYAEGIVDAYKNGKFILDLKYPVGRLFDSLGNPLVYIENYGIARYVDGTYFGRNGEILSLDDQPQIIYDIPLEEGLLCQIVENGKPIYTNPDGSAEYFIIQNVNLVYSGIVINEIRLMESSSQPTDFVMIYSQPEHSTITVKSYDKTLISGSNVTKGSLLSIYATFDVGYGLKDNLMNINGNDVSIGANDYWTWAVQSDVSIKPNVIYLGGKYLHITKDSDCQVTVLASPISGTGYTQISDGDEIFTNQTLTIRGNVTSGIKPKIFVNGIEKTVTFSGSYSFEFDVKVYDSDINILIQTQSLSRTLTVNIDPDALQDYSSQPFLKINESEYNPTSAKTDVYNNGTLFLKDNVSKYALSLNRGYSVTSTILNGLKVSDDYSYEVVDNVEITYETTFSATKSTICVMRDAIVYRPTYGGYDLAVVRTASKAGGTLGNISSYSGTLNSERFTGYDVLIKDTIAITLKALNDVTGGFETPDCTIVLKPSQTSDDGKIEIKNGQSFTPTTTTYFLSANITS